MVRHGERDRRHGHLKGHAVLLDRRQLRVEVEAAVQADRGSRRRRGEEVQEPQDVRRRRGHLEPVVVAEAESKAPVRDR